MHIGRTLISLRRRADWQAHRTRCYRIRNTAKLYSSWGPYFIPAEVRNFTVEVCDPLEVAVRSAFRVGSQDCDDLRSSKALVVRFEYVSTEPTLRKRFRFQSASLVPQTEVLSLISANDYASQLTAGLEEGHTTRGRLSQAERNEVVSFMVLRVHQGPDKQAYDLSECLRCSFPQRG